MGEEIPHKSSKEEGRFCDLSENDLQLEYTFDHPFMYKRDLHLERVVTGNINSEDTSEVDIENNLKLSLEVQIEYFVKTNSCN